MPKIFSDAMRLPAGEYYTPKLAHIRPDEARIVMMYGEAVTNATSKVPVIGTHDCDPCISLILYNPKTKTAALNHDPNQKTEQFLSLLNKVRSNDTDPIEVHIVGRSIIGPETGGDTEKLNREAVETLTRLLNDVAAQDHLTLKTFDVFDKPKTHAVAIDARDGTLIRGTELYVKCEDGLKMESNFGWPYAEGDRFDGTIPKLQKQIRL